ncbi:MAG: hypothetical protein J5842_04000, partial [Lachnospiraceae bacterium]|nr:hypothetical protein [Lachnospiraceae bacterium]
MRTKMRLTLQCLITVLMVWLGSIVIYAQEPDFTDAPVLEPSENPVSIQMTAGEEYLYKLAYPEEGDYYYSFDVADPDKTVAFQYYVNGTLKYSNNSSKKVTSRYYATGLDYDVVSYGAADEVCVRIVPADDLEMHYTNYLFTDENSVTISTDAPDGCCTYNPASRQLLVKNFRGTYLTVRNRASITGDANADNTVRPLTVKFEGINLFSVTSGHHIMLYGFDTTVKGSGFVHFKEARGGNGSIGIYSIGGTLTCEGATLYYEGNSYVL